VHIRQLGMSLLSDIPPELIEISCSFWLHRKDWCTRSTAQKAHDCYGCGVAT